MMKLSSAAIYVAVALAAAATARAATLTTTASVDVTGGAVGSVPQSFMGISHEWPHVEEMADQPKYADMLKYLSSFGGGPLSIRIGGGSTDMLSTVPGPEVWSSLKRLHEATGAKFIIGVNLEDGDPELAAKQMAAAKAALPAAAIESFEIGNEPNFYVNRRSRSWQGDWAVVSGEDYIHCCFWTDWEGHAKRLAAPAKTASFAGPAWGHVNVRPSTIDWFLNVNSNYTGLVTLHWYKATKETDVTAASLLDDAPIRKEMENLKKLVGVAKGWGKPLRVAEMNTISNSGRDGVSNVMAAALWTLDACFEVAAAGGVGVNLHQGAGQNLYAALIRWYGDDGKTHRPVGVRAPFYGMALFQQAVGAGAQLLPVSLAGDADGIKVWAMSVPAKKELHIVAINKRAADVDNLSVVANRAAGYGDATVTRLVAAGAANPLEAQKGITLGGQYWDDGANLVGAKSTEKVGRAIFNGKLTWRLRMPPASAALLVIPMQ